MSKKKGLLPNTTVGTINVGSLTRTSAQSCGRCHGSAHGGVTVTVKPDARSLLVSKTTAVTISGSSSTKSVTGGFTADVTKGKLVAGTNTKINTGGTAITHSSRSRRAWKFNYTAPAKPGLVELYAVVNCTNGNGERSGDSYSFHGSSPSNTTSTPVRLYANAGTGVKPTGESCSDGFGNHSVLGAKTIPTRGTNFVLEAFGMAPAAPMLIMFSIGGNVPAFDLAPLGAPGCLLRTTIQIEAVAATGAGNASRAEGAFTLPVPIPSNTPKGLVFAVQFGFIDSKSKRAFPFTVTNGLECTVQ
jgi:hypothetical protein